jgi:hypothetical protein
LTELRSCSSKRQQPLEPVSLVLMPKTSAVESLLIEAERGVIAESEIGVVSLYLVTEYHFVLETWYESY